MTTQIDQNQDLTRELVWTVMDQLKAEKKSTSNRAVRVALGNRGSFKTLSPWMREWREKEDERFRLSLLNIPDAIEEAVELAAKTIWKTASELASIQLIEMGKRLEEQEAGHEREKEGYETDIENHEAAIATLKSERAALAQEVSSLQVQLAGLRSSLMEKTKDHEVALEKVASLQARVGELSAESKDLREHLYKADRSIMNLQARSEIDQESLRRGEATIQRQDAALRALAGEKQRAEEALAREKESSWKMFTKMDTDFKTAAAAHEKALAEKDSESLALRLQMDEARSSAHNFEKSLTAAMGEIQSLQQQLKAEQETSRLAKELQQRIADLELTSEAMRARVEVLSTESVVEHT